MKVAIVYDRVNKFGGAERVLEAIHAIWPKAPLYTAVYDPNGAPWASTLTVRPTFLQYMPGAKKHHEWYPWLTPLAFETLSFDEFDVVISVTSAEAKTVITKPRTMHVCYCLTPTRYLWSAQDSVAASPSIGGLSGVAKYLFPVVKTTLQRWDQFAAARPDYYMAISSRVAERIRRYYDKPVEKIIYPPVDTATFTPTAADVPPDHYYLLVSRLVPYKRVDIVIDAFNRLRWPLVIIGTGYEESKLRAMANPRIIFRSHLTDKELVEYYQKCRAFIFAGDEDFGLVAAEAQACGKPVVSYRDSGIAEVVVDKQSGVLYNTQSPDALVGALVSCEKMHFSPHVCRDNAMRFSQKRFEQEFSEAIDILYKQYRQQYAPMKKGNAYL